MTKCQSVVNYSDQTLIDTVDGARIDEAVAFIRSHDTRKALVEMLPIMGRADLDMIGTYCRFMHAAVLVFPRLLAAARLALQAHGLMAGEITPSVVVRDRLSRRYAVPSKALDVGIAHALVDGDDGEQRDIEIFLLPTTPGSILEGIAVGERAHSHETHIAFEVAVPDYLVLSGLRELLTGPGRLRCDGGGYNGNEDATVLYFIEANRASFLHRRLELNVKGHFPRILRDHIAQTSPPERCN